MLLHEKAAQVQPLLHETGLDCWLIFVRETDIHPDPGFELVVGAGVVRNSAFLFGAGGERIGIVAQFDTANVRGKGVFGEVVPKNLAIAKADRLAALVAPALLIFYRVSAPFVVVIERSAQALSQELAAWRLILHRHLDDCFIGAAGEEMNQQHWIVGRRHACEIAGDDHIVPSDLTMNHI